MDHEDMKAGLLQELIEKLMEMPEGKEHESQDAGGDPDMMDEDSMDKSSMMAPRPGALDPMASHMMPDSKMMADKDMSSCDDMSKSLSPADMMAMKRKHMGL